MTFHTFTIPGWLILLFGFIPVLHGFIHVYAWVAAVISFVVGFICFLVGIFNANEWTGVTDTKIKLWWFIHPIAIAVIMYTLNFPNACVTYVLGMIMIYAGIFIAQEKIKNSEPDWK